MRERWMPARRREGSYPLMPWEDVDRAFRDMFEAFLGRYPYAGLGRTLTTPMPRADIYRKDGNVFVEIELPGIDPKEIDIRAYSDRIVLKADRKQEVETEEENYLRSERYYGSLSRTVHLPVEVLPDTAKASYSNGVLSLKMEEAEGTETGRSLDIEIVD